MSGAKFCWYELMTYDAEAAKRFYGDVVGWTALPQETGDTPYEILAAAGRPIGGMLAMTERHREAGARPHWLGYIAVDDVDAKARAVAARGGDILHPGEDIPGVARFSVVTDPQGAAIVLFKPLPAEDPPPEMPTMSDIPGYVTWRELLAGDGASAFDFYADQFGWTRGDAFDMGADGMYQLFAIDGETAGGMMTKPAAHPRPEWLYYFAVDGIGAAIDRVKAGGGRVINGPMQVPGDAWIVHALDPEGVLFALLSMQA